MKNKSSEEQGFALWVTLWRTANAVHKVRQRELGHRGISFAQSSILSVVHSSKNNITPAQISRQLMRDANTISELLVNMERDGLLKRVKDLPRKNMIRVELTKKGYETYTRAIAGQTITDIFSVLSEKEQQQFKSYLSRTMSKATESLK
ncbi:MarR family winged helix-turn-helix transcriptional regulator [Chloroflexota bacterium]